MEREHSAPFPCPGAGDTIAGEPVTAHILRCPDGVYRWYYELHLLKNPTVLFTVWSVLGISFGVVWLFLLAVDVADGSLGGWPGFARLTGGFLLLALAFALISVAACAIVSWAHGGSVVLLFEMDDRSVRHILMPRQYGREQALEWLTVLAGIAAGRPSAAGGGLLAMTKNVSVSEFKDVERIALRPRRHLIRVDQRLERNQVYAAPEDYEFVREHIVSRCEKARIR